MTTGKAPVALLFNANQLAILNGIISNYPIKQFRCTFTNKGGLVLQAFYKSKKVAGQGTNWDKAIEQFSHSIQQKGVA